MSYHPVAALVATLASLATLHVLGPVSERQAALSDFKVEGQTAGAATNIAAISKRNAPPLSETSRPPVPILLPQWPAFNANEPSPETVPQDNSTTTSDDSMGQGAARAAIERDGYKGVHGLRQGPNGMWHARALRGQTDIAVTVDSAGNVSAD